MRIFSFFGKSGSGPRLVVDVGAHAIRAALLELPREGGKSPRALKKFNYLVPPRFKPEDFIVKLREVIFSTIKDLGRVPANIVVGLGPQLGEYRISRWSGKLKAPVKLSPPKDLASHFRNFFEEHREPAMSAIAFPLEVLSGGWRVVPSGGGVVAAEAREDLTFKALLLFLSAKVGENLFNVRHALGGLAVELVPAIAVEAEAFSRVLGSDAIIVKISGEESAVSLIKNGALAGIFVIPRGLKEAGRWQQIFLEGLDTLYAEGPLPPLVFLTGEGARSPEIAAFLKDTPWLKEFSYRDRAEVRILDAQNIFGGDTLGGALVDSSDIGLASLIYYSLYHRSLF